MARAQADHTGALKKFAQEARRTLREQVSAKLHHVLAASSAARREAPKRGHRSSRARSPAPRANRSSERVAYTWFNRFYRPALHGRERLYRLRAWSRREGQTRPEILSEAMAGVISERSRSQGPTQVRALLDGRAPSAIRRAKPIACCSSPPATTGTASCRSCSSRSTITPSS